MSIDEALSYDDVLLLPSYADFLPAETDVSVSLTDNITLNLPFLSAAMDTVTESDLAIAIALQGGAGVIHRNLSPDAQAQEVRRVKRYLNWIIDHPLTVSPTQTVGEVREIMEEKRISGLPVIDEGTLIGIVTSRDLRFSRDDSQSVRRVMTPDPVVEVGSPTI
ncbi:MAG: IMP dehydrogenase, partial [Alkalispirochaetaceae bacterium]